MDEDGVSVTSLLFHVFIVPCLLFHTPVQESEISPPETLAVGRIVSNLGAPRKVPGLKHRVRRLRARAKPPNSLWSRLTAPSSQRLKAHSSHDGYGMPEGMPCIRILLSPRAAKVGSRLWTEKRLQWRQSNRNRRQRGEASASLWCYCNGCGGVVCCRFKYGGEPVRSGSRGSQTYRSSARLVPAPYRVQPRCARPAPGADLPGTACSASGDAALAGSEFSCLFQRRPPSGIRQRLRPTRLESASGVEGYRTHVSGQVFIRSCRAARLHP